MKAYQVQFGGLKNGEHEFSWQIDDAFLQGFEVETLRNLHCNVVLQLEKKTRLMELNFKLQGSVIADCDRCADPVNVKIDSDFDLVVKFSQETDFTDDAVVFVSETEHTLNVAQFIYEYLMVGLPTRIIHPDGECNEEVVDYLEASSEDQELEQKPVDPRWEALKRIKTNE